MVVEKKWYAVYTRPRWEKKVALALSKKNITNYCPLNRVLRQWSDRKKLVYEPLFTCYVFVQIGDSDMIQVKETDGVLKFVYWLQKPAVIKDAEIEVIKQFLNDHINVSVAPIDINVSDVVRIINGPLMQYQGSIVSIEKSKVKVLLPSLGYMMTAILERSNIEVIKKTEAVSAPGKHQ